MKKYGIEVSNEDGDYKVKFPGDVKKFQDLETLKSFAKNGNIFAKKQLQEIVKSQRNTIVKEIFTAISSKYVEYYTHYDKVPTRIIYYDGKPNLVRHPASDIINMVFLDRVKHMVHPKGYQFFVGFENGIHKKKLDSKTFALLIVDKVNDVLIAEKKSGRRMAIRYRLFLIGANCHYWARKYERMAVIFANKYHIDNKVCINNNMVWVGGDATFKKVKPLENVIISDENINKITSAIDQFINDKEAYEKYGIPYRLGILLYGEPGTGKSTLIYSLALKYHRYITTLNRTRIKNNLEGVESGLFSNTMSKFYIIEEIDTLLADRGTNDAALGKEAITGFIDGMDNGAILFATTNFKEKTDAIDPAILRPGRFSVQIEMNRFDKEMAIKMCNKFGLEEEFADNFEYPLSPAELEFEITQELYRRAKEENHGR